MEMFFMKRFLVVVFVILVAATAAAADECGGNEASGCRNKREALKLKAVAIAAILCAGAIGVCFPICTKNMFALRAEGGIFFVIKAFGAGVILATGFVHILPDAFECLGSDCLSPNPWANFPMAGMIAMATALGTLMIDAIAMSYYQRSHYAQQSQKSNDGLSSGNGVGGLEKGPVNAHSDTESARNGLDDGRHETHIHAHSHASHGHAHGSNTALEDATLRRKIVSQVLELGIVVHSVIIGVSLGASQSPCTIRPLVAALTFHQFFEGMGLGSCILQAAFRARSKAVMAILFSITTPFGIAVGIGISSSYRENSPKALAVEGVLNAASSGILIYMSLVDLLAADFLNSRMQKSAPVQLGAYLALLFGAAAMSLLAVWA